MRIKFRLSSLIALSLLLSCPVFAQIKKTNQQPLPVVTYDSNVDAPLTTKELKFINEVYGDKTQEDILNHPQRVKDIKNILRNRVTYRRVDNPAKFKECKSLSEVPLFDDYVVDLDRDIVFNPETFNPLKYEFNFYSRSGEHYKVDNTNYYIFISSQHLDTYRLKQESSKSKN